MLYIFDNFALDCDRRELRRDNELLSIEPQVFDLLQYLIRNRDRVVSKDDIVSAVWQGRIVSDATLSSRINAARSVLYDNGEEQRLIRTIIRRGIRFVGAAVSTRSDADPALNSLACRRRAWSHRGRVPLTRWLSTLEGRPGVR